MARWFLAAVIGVAAGIGHAAADSQATVRGVVRDEAGAALPGVTVQVEGGPDASPGAITSDARGSYEASGLLPGRRRLTFRLPGFATAVKTLTLAAGDVANSDVTLRVALSSDVLVTTTRTFRSLAELGEPVNGLLGLAGASSEGVVSLRQLAERPLARAGDVMEAVPGLLVSQHSGDGKANQYYVRGFNIDHGTDLASFVAGVPVNLPSHGHGQGYSDNNFLIPELVSGVQYQKGTYAAEAGDFSAAGTVDVSYLSVLDRPLLSLETGAHRFGRVLLAASGPLGAGHLLYAAEAHHDDGPWINAQGYRRLNGVLRYSRGDQGAGLSLTAMAYSGRWRSSDQVPRRAVESGAVDRFGAVDPTDHGRTHRLSLSGQWRRSGGAGLTQVKVWALDYGLDLFSNFTYFLDDPVNGDQFEQRDRRRALGAQASRRVLGNWLGRASEAVFGIDGRLDSIPAVGLYRAREGRRLAPVREDEVAQRSAAAFVEARVQWTPWLRSSTGLRADGYGFDVRSSDAANSGRRTAALASPKLGLALGPWRNAELYANWGWGFHSNDARGAVQSRDPRTGQSVAPVDPLVRARGAEVGVRALVRRRYQATLALWGLDLDSELLFVGDAGTTEASRPSRRRGLEWSNVFTPAPWLTLDADLAWSRARFRDGGPAADRIPGAVARVAAAGVSIHGLGPLAGSLRLRHVGRRPLTEDGSVRSQPSTTVNLRLAFTARRRHTFWLEVFNLTDAAASDADYFYVSRLPGEPAEGVADVHTHPLQGRSLRLGFTTRF